MSQARRYNSPSFVLYLSKISPNSDKKPSKFSFSVSKKIAKSAVDRNRLRRRGYSIVSKYIKTTKSGFYCFFSYKSGYERDFYLLEKELIQLLSSSSVII